jgi:hypothetical protein
MDDIMLLKVGRHLRPSPNYKLIISREEGEGNFLQGYRSKFLSLNTVSHAGPLALIDGEVGSDEIELAARIVARYSQGRSSEQVELELTRLDGTTSSLSVVPMPPHEIPAEWAV